VAAKAKNRKRKVPTNSPMQAMSKWRALLGSHPKPGNRFSLGRLGSSVYLGFMPGRVMKLGRLEGGRVAFISAVLEMLVGVRYQVSVDESV
jgi:hypothetical protein